MDKIERRHFLNRSKEGASAPGWVQVKPGYRIYGNLPMVYVNVYWDTEITKKRARVLNVTVTCQDYSQMDDEAIAAITKWDTFSCTTGCCCADWGICDNMESVFARLCGEYVIDDEQEFYRALYEFGRVKECEWARKMLQGVSYRIVMLFEQGLLVHPMLIDYARKNIQ